MERNGILLLCEFEHIQLPNWSNGAPDITANELYNNVSPLFEKMAISAGRNDFTFSSMYSFDRLEEYCVEFVELANSKSLVAPCIDDKDSWEVFVKEMYDSCYPPGVFSTRNCGGWLLSKLYWDHFSSFRLLLSWALVSFLNVADVGKELALGKDGLGTLIGDLSASGPPIYDAERLRGHIASYA